MAQIKPNIDDSFCCDYRAGGVLGGTIEAIETIEIIEVEVVIILDFSGY
jgi:hypothetical protein